MTTIIKTKGSCPAKSMDYSSFRVKAVPSRPFCASARYVRDAVLLIQAICKFNLVLSQI